MTREVRRGTYVLLLDIPLFEGEIGLLGDVRLDAGRYCYVGSAMGGLDQRLSRHLRPEKKVKWHVDRLTLAAERIGAWESYPDYIEECRLAHIAEECGMVPVIPGFGCSDCKCQTHLFRVDAERTERMLLDSGMVFFGIRGQSSG